MTTRTLVDEASDPETSFQRLLQLSLSDDVEVRRALVDNPSIAVDEDGVVTSEIVLGLAGEFTDEVAMSPSFALFGLELKDDSMLKVARAIGVLSKSSVVLSLIFHEFRNKEFVTSSIANNRFAPEEVLRILGNVKTEQDSTLRRSVARNPSTPKDVLRILGNATTEPMGWVRVMVVDNPSAPEDVFRVLGNVKTEPSQGVRVRVAKNSRTPEDVIRSLGNLNTEPDEHVRVTVIENRNVPEDLLRALSNADTEPMEWIRKAAKESLSKRGLR